MLVAALAIVSFLVVFGVVAWWEVSFPSAEARRTRTLLHQAVPFRLAEPGALAKLTAEVRAVEAVARGPIAKKEAVFVALTMSEDRGGDSFDDLWTVHEQVPFVLVAEGQTTTVDLGRKSADALARLRLTRADTGPVVAVPDELAAFCARKGRKLKSEDGFVRRSEFRERILEIGTKVTVVGTKRGGEGGGSANAAGDYRTSVAPASEAVLVVREMHVGSESDAARPGQWDVADMLSDMFSFGPIISVVVGTLMVLGVLYSITTALLGK